MPTPTVEAAIAAGGIPATFAAGCFWGTERYFKKQFGNAAKPDDKTALLYHEVGFMSGSVPSSDGAPITSNPGYSVVKKGQTGTAEVFHLYYDPKKVRYDDLVYFFFRMHNPTELNHQGNDYGTQYRTAVMVHNDEQKNTVNRVIRELSTGERVPGQTPADIDPLKLHSSFERAFGPDAKIVTRIEPASTFWRGEDYHQEYLDNQPGGYCNHRIYWSV